MVGAGGGISFAGGDGGFTLHNTIVADNYLGNGSASSEIDGLLNEDSSHNLLGTSDAPESGGLKSANQNRFFGHLDVRLGGEINTVCAGPVRR